MDPLAVSPDDAARLLGISRSTVYLLISDDELASFNVGHRRLITVESIHSYVARKAQAKSRDRTIALPHVTVAALQAAAQTWLHDYELMGRQIVSDRERAAVTSLRAAISASDTALAHVK